MKLQSGPILVLSDLSSRSDHAIGSASVLASSIGAELHVLHALALTGRTLREAMPILQNVGTAIREADETLRVQIERAAGGDSTTVTVRVDVENSTQALLTRAREINAGAVVVPAHWQWQRFGHNSKALSHIALSTLRTPLLVNACPEPTALNDRVVLVAHPDALDASVIDHTERWRDLVTTMNSVSQDPPDCAEIEVFLLDGSMKAGAMVSHIEQRKPDLIVVATESFRYTEGAAAMATLTGMLATSGTATVMLPGELTPGRIDGDTRNRLSFTTVPEILEAS